MNDITPHNDDELSLLVFNDEYFYIERANRKYLLALIKEEFVYTKAQMAVLVQDLDDDAEET